MAIYKMVGDKVRLDTVRKTSFLEQGIKESPDLRHLLRAHPEVIEEGLFILSEEFSGHWQGSGRSVDLLGLDSDGRLVVIELKRTPTGDYAELQAIRYAAMVAVLNADDIVEAHRSYLAKWEIDGDAEQHIRRHLENTDYDEIYTKKPRIILVSEGFATELTTSALWLNENGLDITCLQLQLYGNDSELLLESSQVVPVPGTEGLLMQGTQRSGTGRPGTARNPRIQGGDSFAESIEQAPEHIQPGLNLLYEWATALEKEGLAELYTRQGSTVSLAINVRGDSALVSVYSSGHIRFWPDIFNRIAPNSLSLLDGLIDSDIASAKYSFLRAFSRITEEVLAALTESYREANGLVPESEDIAES